MKPGRVWGLLQTWLDGCFPSVVEEAVLSAEIDGWAIDTLTDYCPRCGASVAIEAVGVDGCPFCIDGPIHWHRLTRLSMYQEPMADWVKAMKFHRQWRWGLWMGQQLAQAVGPAVERERVVVTMVPMHWRRRWMRGYNQAQIMAEALAKARGWRVAPLLRRIRHARPQSLLSPTERIANVRGCFAAHPIDLTGLDIVLVDDVKTTGATLATCTRLLKRQGARSVHVAVAAVADPKGQGFKTK